MINLLKLLVIFTVSVDCDPGSYISGTDCLLCDFGYYQPARHQESCIKCGVNLNTSTEGASKQGECQR